MHAPAPHLLRAQAVAADTRPALRFLTCGSVDDGKSTLIGRLLYEQNLIFDDHLVALERDSRKHGTNGAEVDYALLLDGLEAEREQGITIDVAYRYFATARRSFIVADTPGHEQYTRNMATGASNADLAVLLVDARKGLLAQTRRHAIIASLLGIRYAVLAVNKIDLVGYDRTVFEDIVTAFNAFAAPLGFKEIRAIPISARHGDNVSSVSANTPWYDGLDLLSYLETVDVEDSRADKPFRMPVQWVNRPNLDFRGFAGTVASGSLVPGDEIAVLPSGQKSTVKAILNAGTEIGGAEAGDAVTVTLADEIDIARGDMLVALRDRPQVADQFAAHLVWMSAEKLMPGRSYLIKINHATLAATVTELKHKLDINTLAKLAAKTLSLNEVGVCNLSVARPIAFDPYAENRDTGAFILIDRATNETVAAGMVDFALRRATNIHQQKTTVSKADRVGLKHHKPAVLWFTGLSGAGKSTIANLVEAGLHARGIHTIMLDGDNVRHGLNKDLGFTETDRVENIRRIGEVARLMTEAGLVVLCSFISPFRAERSLVRELMADGEFIEIFVDAPLETCIARDVKGLYRRAKAGEIKNFTGVDQPYEAPQSPELHLKAGEREAAALADEVVEELIRREIMGSYAPF
jgi:bifunctional enzyme CysN/CysC